MSWAQDEWKNNLPHVALQKIDVLEKALETLKKDQQQKKFQLESITASFENQKKKTEEQKNQVSLLKKDIQIVEERYRESEIAKEKVSLIKVDRVLISITYIEYIWFTWIYLFQFLFNCKSKWKEGFFHFKAVDYFMELLNSKEDEFC